MFIKLRSYKDGNTLLIPMYQVTHIARRAAGGSTVYFAMEAVDPKGGTKQKLLAVQDSIEGIAKQLELVERSSFHKPGGLATAAA